MRCQLPGLGWLALMNQWRHQNQLRHRHGSTPLTREWKPYNDNEWRCVCDMDVTLYSPGTFQDGNIPQAGSDSLLENIFFLNEDGGKKENKEEKSVKFYIKNEEGKKRAVQAQTDANR